MSPLVFISYSHDSNEHKTWIRRLATDLRANDVDATLDQWDLSPGQDIAAFMQQGVSNSDRVLLVCSESYVRKSDAGSGGVGYERLIVTSELVSNIDTKKFLPIVRNNQGAQKTPSFLGPRLFLDFTDDADYGERLEQLLRELHGSPANPKPPLGPNPFSGSVPTVRLPSRTTGPTGVTQSGGLLLDDDWFARSGETALIGLTKLDFKASMELRFALHSPINKSQMELLNAVRKSHIRTFGWPIGIVLENRDKYRPVPNADGISAEVAISKDGLTGRRSYDYWGLRNTGDFYLLQSLFEDDRDPAAIFFNTRIVRVAEAFLFAANLYDALAVPGDTKVSARITHRGLAGRALLSSNPARVLFLHPKSVEDVSQSEVIEETGKLRDHLVANVRRITEPLFMLFDFTQFEPEIYEDIVTKFVGGRAT